MGPGTKYTIEDLASILKVKPKDIRIWERYTHLSPSSSKTSSLYTEYDLKRISFIQGLLMKGFNISQLSDYLALYPCWLRDDCPECMSKPYREGCAKPCWKEKGMFCQLSLEHQGMCRKCKFSKRGGKTVIPLNLGSM
jgi:MerR family transcriptional regulator/heat shock protein HspR